MRVTAVKEQLVGTELAADAAAAATELDVVDWRELDALGGTLQIGPETHVYSIEDETVVLETPLDDDYEAEKPVLIYPTTYERVAYLRGPDQEEELAARVPHQLYALLPTGIRDDDTTAEVVETAFVDGELVATDVIGRRPEADVGYFAGFELNAGTADIDTDTAFTIESDPIEHGLSAEPTTIVGTADYEAGRGTARVLVTVGDANPNTFRIKIRSVDDSVMLDEGAGGAFIRVHWIAVLATSLIGRPDREPSGNNPYGGAGSID